MRHDTSWHQSCRPWCHSSWHFFIEAPMLVYDICWAWRHSKTKLMKYGSLSDIKVSSLFDMYVCICVCMCMLQTSINDDMPPKAHTADQSWQLNKKNASTCFYHHLSTSHGLHKVPWSIFNAYGMGKQCRGNWAVHLCIYNKWLVRSYHVPRVGRSGVICAILYLDHAPSFTRLRHHDPDTIMK